MFATGFDFSGVGGGVAGGHEKPVGEDGGGAEHSGLLDEDDEHGLRHVFRQVPVVDLAQRGGVDEVDVAGGEGGEGLLVVVGGVAAEEIGVGGGRTRLGGVHGA